MHPPERIPTPIIGLLSQIFPDRYTVAGLTSLFQMSGAPDPVPEGSKSVKVQSWLRQTNQLTSEPLRVLGAILDDFFSMEVENRSYWSGESEQVQKLDAEKQRVREALSANGLTFIPGGTITKGGAVPTLSLDENVKKHGLASVDIEIKRAFTMIEQDPHQAAQYAGNVLEATLKAYLDHKKVTYKSGDTLGDLWKLSAEQIGLRAADWDNKDLKKIASGLHSIVDGIAHLRNNKSGAHGRSEEQRQNITIKPRHARLAIHSAHTVAAYVLELIE
ncbi:abortive infection family protein [Paracoccus sp. MA]|uniref:abortive infection family protein n=1 Tax=Paracoccus sp. MA TaxID=2895796 RepID=UPI001E5283C5|nr:abortive infection family protein [Paracoccus sp. MA]UFM66785.1 abortive infection family protein [Paracoccus sp. MA]